MTALEEASAQLDELIEAAHSGALISFRLPAQLEAIRDLLQQATQEQPSAASDSSPDDDLSDDDETFRKTNAEFMKTAIHELRTPVTNIRGYSDILANTAMSGELNEMQEQLLAVIRNNSSRLESLLTDMSYLNKMRGGILPIAEKMDMFKNIAQMAEKVTRPLAEELNRQLEFDIPQGLPFLNTDGELFAHAMVKLIENGLRYSHDGTGKVIVSGRGESGDLIVTIEDNGIGMSEEELDRLGTYYFRADHDLVYSYKGSGLGVAIAYGLVDLLNGEIWVESEPDHGTTYTLCFRGLS